MKINSCVSIEEAIVLVKSAFDEWERFSKAVLDDWSLEHEARDMAVKALKELGGRSLEQVKKIDPFEELDPPPDDMSYMNGKGAVVMSQKTFMKYQKISVFEALRSIKEQEKGTGE